MKVLGAKMKTLLAASLLAVFLAACGGGGETGQSTQVSVTAPPPAPVGAVTEAAPDPGTVQIVLSPDAPNDTLLTDPTSVTTSSATLSTYCGNSAAGSRLTGTVTKVHDGDTITVAGLSIRLDSIDAPELAQAYGTQSRDNLASMVNGQAVTITYAKKDKYGRIVGTVYKSDCTQVNLRQVASGSAWYYEAYKCEIAESQRNSYAAAQESAKSSGLGLWATVSVAPWVFRNGTEATVPASCSGGSSPSWGLVTTTPPAVTTPTPGGGSGTVTPPVNPANQCYMVWVNGYRKANGTWVNGYYRRSPGCA